MRFSTNEPWSIEAAASEENSDGRFRVTPAAGEAGERIAVTIHADENPAYVDRNFTLTLRTESLEASVNVAQRKRNAIIAGENRYELTSAEQTLVVEVQANVTYDVEVAAGGEWLSPAVGSRAEAGLVAREHRFAVAANTAPAERRARVVFRDADSDLSDEVTVVQAAWVDPNPERTALRAIYREAHGDGWTRRDNWCSDLPLDEWYGVGTDAEGHVTELRLPHNNLQGGIAHEITDLVHLRILDLSYNKLDCELMYDLPEEYEEPGRSDLDNLTKLEEINLSHNRLRSARGDALALQNMPSLRKVDLSYCGLQCQLTYQTAWAPLFENGRTVELIFNGNRMYGDVAEYLQNHPEWDRLALQLVRQYYPQKLSGYKEIHIPNFTFTDLRNGAQQSIRDVCSANELTMLLAWDPTDEGSRRFAERSVRRYHTLYGAQGFAVVAILPEGEEYRQAAEQYLSSHDVAWPVVADYADAVGRRIILPMEPYPSYLLFDRNGVLKDNVHNHTSCLGSLYPEESATFDLVENEFQYANYMNSYCYNVFGDCTYESADYSRDKQVETLQRATRGNGIDIVLIGDVFTDIDIETGFYRDAMEFAMEAFFAVEPTKSYREYFNVHTVYAVSKRRQLGTYSDCSALSSALDKYSGTGISLFPYKVDEYVAALRTSTVKVPGIIINSDRHGVGRVTSFRSATNTAAYVGFPNSEGGRGFLRMMIEHEFIGHGFGLLGDEYSLPNPGSLPESEKRTIRSYQQDGSFLNLSLTNDPKLVPWAHMIGHPRYPEVGVGEGGMYYETGIWRAMPPSLMGYGDDFSPVCRELIVKRIYALAGEEYSFEKFLEKDVTSTRAIQSAQPFRAAMEFLHCPPVLIDKK